MLNLEDRVTNLCHVVTLSDSEDCECVSKTSKYGVSNNVSLGSTLLKPKKYYMVPVCLRVNPYVHNVLYIGYI